MRYATASQLLARYAADEIAQRADTGVPSLVDGALLQQAAAGADQSGYSEEERLAAAAALSRIERALGDAEQTINTYLGGRYQLPLSQTPDVLERIACQIARFVLYDDSATEQIKTLYQDAIKFLDSVATGKVQLGVTALGESAAPAGGAEMVSEPRVFARSTSGGFI